MLEGARAAGVHPCQTGSVPVPQPVNRAAWRPGHPALPWGWAMSWVRWSPALRPGLEAGILQPCRAELRALGQ